MPVWYVVPFLPHSSPLFLLSLPPPPSLSPPSIRVPSLPIPRFPPQIQLGEFGERSVVSFPVSLDEAKPTNIYGAFWVENHAPPVISYCTNIACTVIRTGSAATCFLEKNWRYCLEPIQGVPVWYGILSQRLPLSALVRAQITVELNGSCRRT